MRQDKVGAALPDRRAFVRDGALWLLGVGVVGSQVDGLLAAEPKRRVRIGLVTDVHYADKPTRGSRHYRESLAKLEEVGEQFAKDRPDHVVELGDFIDAADSVDVEEKYLKRVNKLFTSLPGKKHYVLGNHCVHTLSKAEFLGGVGQAKSHYSFDAGGYHFVILDACFRSDGQPYHRANFKWYDANIPADQIDWLRADLKSAKGQAVVFVHQRLDVKNQHGIKNAAAVRKVLEASGKVLAVFQGHSHQNDHRQIADIHYCVHAAMVEGSGESNNGYATMDLYDGGVIRIKGFRRQKDYAWS